MASKDFQEFSTVKYEILISFEINGVVEKSDVVGAIFGQTEGLIGEDLDIRELQKNGRIGRINVEMESKEGVTSGLITIPSSLDKVATAVLAATIETVDRVGPCIAKFALQNLMDVRKTKRDKIIGRATELLQKWDMEVSPESQEITDQVNVARLTDDIVAFGEEQLPAGPDVETSDTIIICEGRADILNLLSIGVKNAIATNGTQIPKTIAEMSKTKTTIAFLDGDRGGDMILNELLQVGKIDFVARAPDGKEVEDLTKKDLLKALQAKMPYLPAKQGPTSQSAAGQKQHNRPPPNQHNMYPKHQDESMQGSKFKNHSLKMKGPKNKRIVGRHQPRVNTPPPRQQKMPTPGQAVDVPQAMRDACGTLLGSAQAIFFDGNVNVVRQVPTSVIVDELQKEAGNVKKIVFDGIISQRLVDISLQEGVDTIIGTRIGNINRTDAIKVLSIDQCK